VDSRLRQVLVYIQSERYDEAIDILHNSYFYRWEGGREVRYYYEDAHLLRGIEYLKKGRVNKALNDFRAATEYPENLEEGRPEFNERFARVYYYLGLAEERAGNPEVAHTYYEKAASEHTDQTLFLYYTILSLRKLGLNEEADDYAEKLVEYASEGIGSRFFAKFGERLSPDMKQAERLFVEGLSHLAAGRAHRANQVLEHALVLNPNHSWARIYYEETLEK
jgi:tetratricopeptide (TPR) repeat protein